MPEYRITLTLVGYGVSELSCLPADFYLIHPLSLFRFWLHYALVFDEKYSKYLNM